jgi:chromate reductase, NAD(P)H dehydrogenase (quinone)
MTNEKPRILGISGSLRRESYSGAVLRGLQEAIGERAGIDICSLASVPLYNADLDGDQKPESVIALKNAIRDCDALVLVSPEYNYGMPGVLKNALDWASRPAYQSVLKHKPVLIITSSPGILGGARAQAQLRQTLTGTLSRVVVVPEVVIPQVQAKIQNGRLTDATSLKIMLEAVDALLAEFRKDSAARQ